MIDVAATDFCNSGLIVQCFTLVQVASCQRVGLMISESSLHNKLFLSSTSMHSFPVTADSNNNIE